MRTRFDVGQKVFFLNVVDDCVDQSPVQQITIVEGDVIYMMENELALPERSVFSTFEQLKAHYSEMLR